MFAGLSTQRKKINVNLKKKLADESNNLMTENGVTSTPQYEKTQI